MRKILCLLLTAVFAISMLLSGCGAKEDSADTAGGSDKTDGKPKDVKLRISWWGSQDRHNDTLRVLDMYKTRHPNVSFKPEYDGFDKYFDNLSAQVAANNLPDIINHDYRYIAKFAEKGILLPLDEYVSKGAINLNGVEKSVIEGGKVNGKLYGICLGVNSQAIMYDLEAFKKAGVAFPDEKWTWDDFINNCLKIKQTLNIYGAGCMPGDSFHGLRYYLRQHGNTFYSKDGKKLGYDDDNLFAEFFGMEDRLVKAGALPPPNVRMEIKSNQGDLLVTGMAAMSGYAKNSNNYPDVVSAAKRPIGMTTFPRGKNDANFGHYVKPAMFFTVAGKTKFPDESVNFINYFIGDIEANKILKVNRGIPMVPEAQKALRPMVPAADQLQFDYMNIVSKNSSAIEPPEPPGQMEIEKMLRNIEQEMLYGKITLEDASKRFRKEAESILARAK